jgi:putative hydrolase of the HAD superfamily
VAHVQACLVDAYQTILHTDFAGYANVLPEMAGLPADAMYAEFGRLGPALSTGQLSMTSAFAQILRARGAEPTPGLARDLADKTKELLFASARLYDDALPFLRELRSRGIKTAIVSNCDENTRGLLVELGVAALVDALCLSCEVGALKPTALIYTEALNQLGMPASAALFIDDNAGYCAGATALGISAVQILRRGTDRQPAGGTASGLASAKVVRSLAEVEAML